MQTSRSIMRAFLSPQFLQRFVPSAGVRSFAPPPAPLDIEYPTRYRLRVVPKVPQYPPSLRAFTMQKKLKLMRGPELYHTTLLHKQYGIVATSGGRMKFSHFEMVRHALLRNIDFQRGFALWRIQDPWQPISKKPQGVRMGGGKGGIDHYVTPVKSGQVILEVAGPFEYFEVKKILGDVARKLPFRAVAVSQEIMEEQAAMTKKMEETNLNPWTWKYIIQNNMLGCSNWLSPYDARWFNKYL